MEGVLPVEIMVDIISRLPFGSVLDCRRVSKAWRTLTFHPSFARLHLLRSSYASSSSNKVSFVSLNELKYSYQFHYGEYDDDDRMESYMTKWTKINHTPIECLSFIEFVGSCNGLICLTDRHRRIDDPVYICNPITREYINLTKSTIQTSTTQTSPIYNIVYGFGYHSKTNEYKVVRIIYWKVGERPYVGRVHVYTLGSGSGWRDKGEIKYTLRVELCILANGALHWWEIIEGKILSFDLVDEEFCLLPSLPSHGDVPWENEILVLGGLLCVVTQKENECVKVWSLKKKNQDCSCEMMKKQDYKFWSWSLEFKIEWEGICNLRFFEFYKPLAVTRSGEVLMLDYNENVLYRYNLKTARLEKLVHPVWEFVGVILHTSSFISLRDLGEDAKIIEAADGSSNRSRKKKLKFSKRSMEEIGEKPTTH